jgi:hypothetical protein
MEIGWHIFIYCIGILSMIGICFSGFYYSKYMLRLTKNTSDPDEKKTNFLSFNGNDKGDYSLV